MLSDLGRLSDWFAHQLNLLLLSIGFFTRLPVLQWTSYSEPAMASSRRYFALVGWILAGLLAGLYGLLHAYVPPSVLAVILIAASLLLTGALHEDGLADVADGFGGGLDAPNKLRIMKDSRLGTYGTSALVLMLLAKYATWVLFIEQGQFLLAIVIAYPVSRGLALSHLAHLTYVSNNSQSHENQSHENQTNANQTNANQTNANQANESQGKSGPVASQMHTKDWLILICTAAISLCLLSLIQCLILIVVCLALRLYLRRLMARQIGGFTGDTLGAAQQLQEISIYIILLCSQVS